MDFTAIGSAIILIIGAIPTLIAYFGRQNRVIRTENRKLRAIVQEADIHVFYLEREGWTRRGRRAPERPPLLQVLGSSDDDDDEESGAAELEPAPEPGAGGGARHRSGE